MRRQERAKPVAKILEGVIPRLKPQGGRKRQRLWEAWEGVVGEEIASRTKIKLLKRGQLHIEVESPALLQELTGMDRVGLAAAMQGKLEGILVTEIRLKLAKD